MKLNLTQFKAVFLLFFANGLLTSCCTLFPSTCGQFETIQVSWPPGKVQVPICDKYSPIVHLRNGYQIQGVTVPVPQAGTSVTVGRVSIDPQTAETVSEAIKRAEFSYTQLCSMLPLYADNQAEFAKTRNAMRDIILGFYQTAYTVADVTGQPKPAGPPAAATAPSGAASTTPAVAPAPPQSTPAPTPVPAANPAKITPKGKNQLQRAADALTGKAAKANRVPRNVRSGNAH